MDAVIREAGPDDAAGCAAVYAPYVEHSSATFELDPPDAAEFARRIAAAHDWLVAVRSEEVVGYAYAGVFRVRPAYAWACETTVYLRQDARGGGLGRALMSALLPRLRDRGFHRAVAGVTLPNPASVGLHRALGFREVGRYEAIGFKLGAWYDVLQLELDLVPPEEVPGPRPR